jgi:hypothetical protein
MRLYGIALVTADGRPVTRRRAAARAAINWSPLVLASVCGIGALSVSSLSLSIALQASVSVLVVAFVLAGAMTLLTVRGVADRLLDVHLVPSTTPVLTLKWGER